MENRQHDGRKSAMVVDIDMLVPKGHLLRKIDKVMDYEWIYERLEPYYSKRVGRPSVDPVVLIKMVLIQHLFGIPSLRQTWREIDVNVAYRWFLGYDLLESIPHFATVSYAFCNRFPAELSTEIFDHILNKALNNRMVDPSVVFIDGTHIKASANKKKLQHERQFAYEAHTACERHSFILGVEVTAGNIHDSVAWDSVYDHLSEKFPEIEALAMDAGYKTPWIARKICQDARIPVLPYTRFSGRKDGFRPWDYVYNAETDTLLCPQGNILRHTTTDRNGKRTYRSTCADCVNCPYREKCGANAKGQKVFTRHIWQEYLDVVEAIRKTEFGKEIYAKRKETIERVFADAKEKHAMRYTHLRGLTRVTQWVRLKFAAMNLKKLARWLDKGPLTSLYLNFYALLLGDFQHCCVA